MRFTSNNRNTAVSRPNLFIANEHASLVANDFTDMRYHASVHHLPPGGQAPVRDSERTETVFFLERGTLEFMVNGATTLIGAGDFVRVPPYAVFAYRNAGSGIARTLERTERRNERLNLVRVTLEYAA